MSDNKEILETLQSISPFFKLQYIRIYYSAMVSKVNIHNKSKPRLIVVSSIGIFLIHKYKFSSKISQIIAFADLVSVILTNNTASFSTRTSQFRIKDPKVRSLAFLTFFVRQALFPTDVSPFTFSFDDDPGCKNGTLASIPYKIDNIFLDRLLSCALHYSFTPTEAQIEEILPFIQSTTQKMVTLTSSLLASPLFPSLALAMAYEQDIPHVCFNSRELAILIKKCTPIFRVNRFIKKVTFLRESASELVSTAPILKDIFSVRHSFHPQAWIFKCCDFSTPEAVSFFTHISKIGKNVKKLSFSKCLFSPHSLSLIFQDILFSECFHGLESFSINEVHDLSQDLALGISELFGCGWAMQRKCLHKIKVTRCSLDGSALLRRILQFDVGLKNLDLSGNNFFTPITFSENSDQNCNENDNINSEQSQIKIEGLDNLNIGYSKVTKSFLESLFKMINEKHFRISSLELDELNFTSPLNYDSFSIHKPSLAHLSNLSCNVPSHQPQIKKQVEAVNETPLYNFLSFLIKEDIIIPGLNCFSFNNNTMNSKETLLFVQFLKNQKYIQNLFVNCSISTRQNPTGLNSFLSYIESIPINSLSLRSDHTLALSFGRLLSGTLSAFSKTHHLKALDITNQAIGQDGLEMVKKIVENGLEELHFDGSNTNNLEYLLEFCKFLLSSEIKFATFPQQDFDRSVRFVPNQNLGNSLSSHIDTIAFFKKEFIEKYGKSAAESDMRSLRFRTASFKNLAQFMTSPSNSFGSGSVLNKLSEKNEATEKPFSSLSKMEREQLLLSNDINEKTEFKKAKESFRGVALRNESIEALYKECFDQNNSEIDHKYIQDLSSEPIILLQAELEKTFSLSSLLASFTS